MTKEKYTCRECGKKELTIMGTGYYGDNIEVECQACGEFYEVEPDGLGQGGLEFILAQQLDSKQ